MPSTTTRIVSYAVHAGLLLGSWMMGAVPVAAQGGSLPVVFDAPADEVARGWLMPSGVRDRDTARTVHARAVQAARQEAARRRGRVSATATDAGDCACKGQGGAGCICNKVRKLAEQDPDNDDLKAPVDEELPQVLAQDAEMDAEERAEVWWDDYCAYYGKSYGSAAAERRAFKNFARAMKQIDEVNNDPTSSWWASGNALSDMSFEEFQATYLGAIEPTDLPAPAPGPKDNKKQKKAAAGGRRLLQIDEDDDELPQVAAGPPAVVNWVAKGKDTKVKNQGGCGSCWAFAAVSAVESSYLIRYGRTAAGTPKLDLSEQELVSCVKDSMGCNGGGSNAAFEWMKANNVTVESVIPYKSITGTCPSKRGPYPGRVVQLASTAPAYTMVNPQRSELALRAAVAIRPTVVYINADANFMNYRGGVFKPKSFTTNINHAVVAVGYNITQRAWTIKNSWGTGWGEAGYIRIAMNNAGASDSSSGINGMYMYAFTPSGSFRGQLAN